MKIVSYEDYIKDNKKSDISKTVSEYQELKAKIDYANTKKATDEAQKTIKNAINQEKANLGVKMPSLAPLSRKNTVEYTDDNGRSRFKSAFENNQENINKYTQQLQKNQQIIESSPLIKQLNNLSQEVNNQKLIAKYNYDVAKENNHDINLWDRTGGVVTRALGDFFNPEKLDSGNYYHSEKGAYVLPTASQIRQENVRNSYGDDILGKAMKFGTDVGYNLTKIGLSSAMNAVVPGSGSTMYFTDMASDSFNNAKQEGYDDTSAALSSVVGVATEMVTEKLMGGFSKLMGGESAVSSSINKVLGKVMKNDRLRSTLANAASEGMEEFVQEYIENLNHNLILDKNSLGESLNNTFTKKTLEDAMYSALVGMGSGGIMGATNVEINTNNQGLKNNIDNSNINTNTYQHSDNPYENFSNRIVGDNIENSILLPENNNVLPRAKMVMNNNTDNNIFNNRTTTKNENIMNHQLINNITSSSINNENISQNIENNDSIRYNSIDEAVKADPRKAAYTQYNDSIDFFNLDYDDMKKAIKIGSQYATEANQMGLDSYSFNDDNNIYYFDILDKKNATFGIKKVFKIEGDYNDITTREYANSNSTFSKERIESKTGTFTSHNQSIENRTSSSINDGLLKSEQEQSTFDEGRQSFKNNTKNIRELDNSSFSVQEKNLKGNDVLKSYQNELNNNLSENENAELESLISVREGGFADNADIKRIEYLESKRDGLIKYPELKNKIEFKDISKEYTKFKKDNSNFNSSLLNEAKDSVSGYRNTKTKSQWLEVAEKIGLHFKGNSQELTDYAVQSWLEAQPNTKNSLNREGKGYVKFSIEEWVNSVYKGAGVGEKIANKKNVSTPKIKQESKINNTKKNYTQEQIDDFWQYDDNENRKIAFPNDLAIQIVDNTTMTSNDFGRMQNIIYSAYDTKVDGDHLEINSDYENNLYNIKATKFGDTYVIDDVVKKSRDGLGSITEFTDNNTNSNLKNETKNSDVLKFENENSNNKNINVKDKYNDTVNNSKNLKESKFYKNATETSKFITEDNRSKLSEIGDLKYYESISNEKSLNEASKRLNENGTAEAFRWLQQDKKVSDSIDVAEGWILLKNYQDTGDFNSMVAVAKKMREMGTTAGQAVQAYNIMQRLTPEGMVKYAQSELSDAYDVYVKNKSQKWIDDNSSSFDLTPQETGFIVDTMKEVQKATDERTKKVKLGEIQKMLENKLPPEKGAGIKSWMRISMLFNPKTQIRNVLGNAVISPVNMVGDFFASKMDKIVAKKTGVRTTGSTDIKSYLKGFKKGLFESYDDFKRGINTRDVDANRFEIGQGKSFSDKNAVSRALNKIDSMNSFLLDIGDRGFFEASFTNSINNQLVLNNKTKVTQEMIDIATSEALQRTWQDNNNYTKFVLQTRNALNKVNVKGYGLGDVLIPFAKTPANLTKAIVDYSPAGMVKVLIEGRNLKNNISTGKNTAIEQHRFVQDLGKATAGTMLYIGAYALAKAGVATGESDDDKDTRDFMKNTLGVSSYSIKIGDKSFTYDWAQPVAAPLSIMTNIVNSKNNKGQALLEAITSSLDSAGSILLEQSFVKSINEVLTNNDGIVSGLENAMLDLPTRAIPTVMKQITDMTDGTQRQTYEYQQPLKTEINKIKAKIPGLSQTLSPSVDTMGREIQKYGGKNNIFNVFLNPANVNTSNISKSAKEIYRVYKEVGDNSIMPRVAPYYINSKGEKTILNTEQRKDFQKISGNIIEDGINELMDNKRYKSMSDEDKSSVIKKIVDYSYNKARKDILGMEMSNEYNKVSEWTSNGGTVASYYANKKENDYSLQNPAKYSTLKNFNIDYYDYEEYQTKVNEIKKQYSGTNNTNVRKQKVSEYINGLKANKTQKIILYNLLGGYSIKSYKGTFQQTINNLKISAKEKKDIWNTLF